MGVVRYFLTIKVKSNMQGQGIMLDSQRIKKPQFNYCKIEDLNQLETMLISLNFEFPQAQPKQLGQKTSKDFHDLNCQAQDLGHKDLSLIQEVEPRAGFGPATITLPR
jgi:hypothetical protein